MKLAFAGFRHGHIFSLYALAQADPDVEIVRCWEENEQARLAAAEKCGAVFNAETLDEIVCDPEVDAVAIGDAYGRRGAIAIEALKHGKHVISDKPLCTSLNELDEIEKLAAESGCKVGVMLDMRYNPNVQAARKAIADGLIGEVHNISFAGQHPLMYGSRPMWYFEEGMHGGTINDISVHGLDIVPYITGKKLTRIIGARTWNAYSKDVKYFNDCGQFLLEYEGGMGVLGEVSYAAPDSFGYTMPAYWNFYINGTDGVLEFSYNTDGVKLWKNDETEMRVLPAIAGDGNVLHDFVCDVSGAPRDLCTAASLAASHAALTVQAQADRT